MYFVADEVIISGDLPTRFLVSRTPIRNVVSIYDCYSLLHNLFNYLFVPENPYLTQGQLKVMSMFFMDIICIEFPFRQVCGLALLASYYGYNVGTIGY